MRSIYCRDLEAKVNKFIEDKEVINISFAIEDGHNMALIVFNQLESKFICD